MINELVEDYNQGLKLSELSVKYHVSDCFVYHYLPKNNRRSKLKKELHKKIIKEYKKGLPVSEIAEKNNMTKNNIYIILKNNKVKTRRDSK